MDSLLKQITSKLNNQEKIEVIDKKQEAIKRAAREQFLKLKEKGLAIPIFTL